MTGIEVLYTIVVFLLAIYMTMLIGGTLVGYFTAKRMLNQIIPEVK